MNFLQCCGLFTDKRKLNKDQQPCKVVYILNYKMPKERVYNGQVKVIGPNKYILHGHGELLFKNGTTLIGKWEDGKWIGIPNHMKKLLNLTQVEREVMQKQKKQSFKLKTEQVRTPRAQPRGKLSA